MSKEELARLIRILEENRDWNHRESLVNDSLWKIIHVTSRDTYKQVLSWIEEIMQYEKEHAKNEEI